MTKMRCLIFTCVAVFLCPSISSLNSDDLKGAIDAFDGFAERRPSNKARNKEELITTEAVPEEATIQPLEDLPSDVSVQTDRVIPVREEVIESEVVTEKAKCVTGCSVHLNVSNPELIEFVKNSLRSIPSGNDFELVQVIEAVREVQNRIVYYLTVEVRKCVEGKEDSCSPNVVCFVIMERHPWRQTKPQLSYQNCTQDSSVPLNNNENNNSELLDKIVNIFQSPENINIPDQDKDVTVRAPVIDENVSEMVQVNTSDEGSQLGIVDSPKDQLAVTETISSTEFIHTSSDDGSKIVTTIVPDDQLPVTEATSTGEGVQTSEGSTQ